jgi:hypothetical protein
MLKVRTPVVGCFAGVVLALGAVDDVKSCHGSDPSGPSPSTNTNTNGQSVVTQPTLGQCVHHEANC